MTAGRESATDPGAADGGPATASLDSLLGELAVRAGPEGLRRVSWRGEPPREGTGGGPAAHAGEARPARTPADRSGSSSAALEVAAEAVRQLVQYLGGERREFELPLAPGDLPPFRSRVLRELSRVPYGETVSYGQLAARCGRPGAARAVGNAVGRNPLPLVLPCHRVIRSDGSPGGYGGGRRRKRWLLRLEGRREA